VGDLELSEVIVDHSAGADSQVEKTADIGHVRIHRRQFVIGPHPIESLPGWKSIQLHGVGYLSHCPELRVSSAVDANGNRWHLLGLTVQTVVDRSDPLQEIATATSETIQDIYHSWAGRWALVGAGTLHLDCCGMLGCFHVTREVTGGDREFWLSSSPAILADLLGVDKRLSYRIEHGYGFDWYVTPGSGFDSISRLMPGQILNLLSGVVSPRRLLATLPRTLNYEEILDQLQAYLITTLKKVSALSDRLCLPLTSGKDSRTLLAVAKYTGTPVRTYTHSHWALSYGDITLPPRLAKAVGMDHTFYEGGEYRADLEDLYDRHTAGHSVDRDRFYFSHDFFKWCRKGDMILRGGGFDIGRGTRWRFPEEEYGINLPRAEEILETFKQRGFKYAGRDPSGFFPPPLCEAVEKWIAWTETMPSDEIDWRDRFFIDQRMAGWLSSIEQSLDLLDADRFYVANSHRFLALMMQIPDHRRLPRGGPNQVELIRRMTPELLRFPINPDAPLRLHERARRKVKSLVKKLVGTKI